MLDFSQLSNEEQKVLTDLRDYSDRAIAIIVGQVLENRLERLLRSKMRSEKKVLKEMFRPSGPLGTFGSKINLAYLLNLIPQHLYRDLTTLRDIRNLFAHDISLHAFDEPKILSRINKLASTAAINTYLDHRGSKPRSDLDLFTASLPRPRENMIFSGFFYSLILLETEHGISSEMREVST